MTVPSTAIRVKRIMDPRALQPFEGTIEQGTGDKAVLAPGENIATWSLTTTPDAEAIGLMIRQEVEREPELDGLVVRYWLSIDPDMWLDPIFEGMVEVAIEFTFRTDSVPYREDQISIRHRFTQR